MMTPEYQREYRKRNPELVRGLDKKRNDEQRKQWQKDWRDRNPDKLKAIARRRTLKKYGITEEQYQQLNAEQDGRCAICGKKPPLRKTRSGRRYDRLDIDHCHDQGHVRGLLCCNCNAILGHAKDSIETLAAAIVYLEARR